MNIEIKRYIYIHNMYKHNKNKATMNNKQDKRTNFINMEMMFAK